MKINMSYLNRTVTMHGSPLAIEGTPLCIGDAAPTFTLLDNSLKEKNLDDFAGKIKLIVSVPSVDTPVCDIETRKFNNAAVSLSHNVAILVVSTDLPFAQKRFCATAGIEQATTLSDHKTADFGKAYGVLIKDLRLLGRAIFVVDKNNIVQYIQLVEEVGDEPNYEEALDAVRKCIGK
jgi:thiol peroxidase